MHRLSPTLQYSCTWTCSQSRVSSLSFVHTHARCFRSGGAPPVGVLACPLGERPRLRDKDEPSMLAWPLWAVCIAPNPNELGLAPNIAPAPCAPTPLGFGKGGGLSSSTGFGVLRSASAAGFGVPRLIMRSAYNGDWSGESSGEAKACSPCQLASRLAFRLAYADDPPSCGGAMGGGLTREWLTGCAGAGSAALGAGPAAVLGALGATALGAIARGGAATKTLGAPMV